MRKKFLSLVLSAVMLTSFASVPLFRNTEAAAASETRIMEKLDRGLVAVKLSSSVYLSWRLLGDEDLTNQGFDIYRNGTKIASTGAAAATCYTDSGGNATSKYKVVKAGATADEVAAEKEVTPWTGYYERNQGGINNKAGYLDIKFDAPAGGTTSSGEAYTYTANDMSAGDLDGDGEYELIVKWDPSNAQDNSNSGITGDVIIDAYEIYGDGTQCFNKNSGLNSHVDTAENFRASKWFSSSIAFTQTH